MKRNLILIRHTKSDWSKPGQPDFERELDTARIEDARKMAHVLLSLGLKPQLVLCSSAVRTRQTAAHFCEILRYEYNQIQFEKALYNCSMSDVKSVVQLVPLEVKTLALFGHNPSLSEYVSQFGKGEFYDMPTTGVAVVEFDHPNWDIDSTITHELKHFLRPKAI